ncbi:uncharacterized protein LOC100209238 isoform X1 [Hydra vulgaris]|uniref:uncharacterized protein LOC100209238 isoform X1 n=1 Tax=Hydra vulgaris TaxID=6087 RepID=UPI001F5FC23E|nr:uncharacterized protein LOC100209238 [Hydra vulgaris]XP_047134547.1 uncharacterized protein LOC100209238 [Hydra vulgaris]
MSMNPKQSNQILKFTHMFPIKDLCVDAPISWNEATLFNKTSLPKDADCKAFRATNSGTQPHSNAKVGIMWIFDNDFNEQKRSEDNKLLTKRIGTEYDVKKLKKLALLVNYDVEIHKNKNKLETLDILQKNDCKNLLTVNSFVCFFLSHGFNGGVYASDGEKLTFNDMQTAINKNPVNGLKDIQKVLFIQACQGDGDEKEVLHNEISLAENADYGIFVVHNPDPVSCHQINGGLSYIQTFCKVLKEHAATNSILDMLLITSSETQILTTAFMTLTKSFQFKPKGRLNERVLESTDCSISQSDSRDVCTDSLSFKESLKINDSDNIHTILNNIPIVAESNTKCANYKAEMAMNPKQSNQISKYAHVFPQNDLCIDDSISVAQRDTTSIILTSLANDLDCCPSDAEMSMNPKQSNQISKFKHMFPSKDLCVDAPISAAQSKTTSLNHRSLPKDANYCTSGATISGIQLYNNTNPGICHIIYSSDKFLNIVFELENVFEWLNCKVYKHEIKDGHNILDIIKNLPIIQENVSYLVCFFFGFKKKANDKKLGIGDIQDAINSNSAQWLIGKPKFFFFENCQVDENVTLKEQTSLAENAGFCFILASTPGTVSIRQPNHGSWFIQALYKISKKHAKNMSLFDMVSILFSEIATKKYVISNNVAKQMPIIIINPLGKSICFNPKEGKLNKI